MPDLDPTTLQIPDTRQGLLRYLCEEAQAARSLAPLLKIFRVRGKPMTLDEHYQLAPVFKMDLPKRMVFCSARQVGKTYAIGTQGALQTRLLRGLNTLFIQPRFDQIKKFSNNVVGKLMNTSYYRDWLVDDEREQSIGQRSIMGGGEMYFSHAFLDADRVRGISCGRLVLDELGDIIFDLLPVLAETMSAETQWGFHMYAGTPKTTDGTLSVVYEDSSQAEWIIKCGCGKENIPNTKHDTWRMLQPKGCCCASCGRVLDVSTGQYIHAYPDRVSSFEGYHLPQIVHPLHANYPRKWEDLLFKYRTYHESQFKNEVLGEAADESLKPITEADLRATSNGCDGTLASAAAQRKKYDAVVLSVDWSGHGADLSSTTVVSALGTIPGDDRVHCFFLERLKSMPPEEEARKIVDYTRILAVAYLAHDFSGAGMIREATLVHMGFPVDQIIPFQIVFAPVSKKIMYFYKPKQGGRSCYNIDKTRSLMVLFEYIKKKKVSLPDYDKCRDTLLDFLNIYQETKETPRGAQFTLMLKVPKKTDDAVFAVNFGCSTIWHLRGRYPSLVGPQLSEEDMNLMDPYQINWRGE